MNREFTQEDYEKLMPFEPHLQRGCFGKYYYGLRRTDFNAMLDVYRSLGYTQSMDYSCGRCILQLTTTLGKPYFEFKKKMEEKAKNTKRKVGEFNADGELVREFESVTQAVSETGITKAQIYKALKEQAEIDERIFKYLQD
jgi:hypothetical protein